MACLQRVGASVVSVGNFLFYRASIGVLACGASFRVVCVFLQMNVKTSVL
jgi:hypothetical protein